MSTNDAPKSPPLLSGYCPGRGPLAHLNKAIEEQNPESYGERRERCQEECDRQAALRLNRRILHDFVAHAFVERQDDFQRANQEEERSPAISPH